MALTPDNDHTEPTPEGAAFARQLPKRIAAIEEIWSHLSDGPWDSEQLDALYERVREISENSKSLSLFQLNESVFSLEVYLSSFVGSDMCPGEAQIDAISGLVRALKTAASLSVSHEDTEPKAHGGVTAFALGDKAGVTAQLTQALRSLDCNIHYFTDTDSLLLQLQTNPPRIIVADTAMLGSMVPLSDELVRLRTHMSLSIPLIFVSSSSALQLRVDAIRAGGDGYFVAPLDAESVALQIRDLATSDQQAPFRVLVVEDDPTQADFAASILTKAGIEVLQVIEPVKVLESLREFRPDLILMDIYMPEVNGIELTSIIRDHQEFVTTPIVFLSGEQNADRKLDALSVGGDDFISKPIRPKHLLGVVENRIRRARQMLKATGQPPKHDRVTGLFSRQHLLDQIAKLIDKGADNGPAAVLLVRPDNLTALRDKIGVGGLDHLLSELGELLNLQTEDQDVAARFDDYSFGLLVRRAQQQYIIELAEQALKQIATHSFADGLQISGSIGLCFIDAHLGDANGIVSRADNACGRAGEQGGNQFHIHGTDIDSQETTTGSDTDLSHRVKQALQQDSFIVQYQPLLDLQTRGSEAYQIVLSIASTEGDLIGDQQLLEAADAAGLCEQLDHWILDRAIDILKRRRDSGRRTHIFVQQSMHNALNPDMPSWLSGRLRTKQIVGTGLVIDFRLPDISHDLKVAQSNIKALREMDVDVSLSRFPEKDAAFKVLRYLQAGYISIAPRLLKADRQVISSVIRQAHDAQAKVIVSNVDDPRSIDLHWSSGADFLQGNFIQRPLENMDYDFSQVVI